MKTKEDKIALLEETAAFFNSGNRSTGPDGHSCLYWSPSNQEGCAIGRLIKDKELCKKLDGEFKDDSSVGSDEVFARLPIEIQEYGQVFLAELQALHDYHPNWDRDGLSQFGKNKVSSIKAGIMNGSF